MPLAAHDLAAVQESFFHVPVDDIVEDENAIRVNKALQAIEIFDDLFVGMSAIDEDQLGRGGAGGWYDVGEILGGHALDDLHIEVVGASEIIGEDDAEITGHAALVTIEVEHLEQWIWLFHQAAVDGGDTGFGPEEGEGKGAPATGIANDKDAGEGEGGAEGFEEIEFGEGNAAAAGAQGLAILIEHAEE